MLGAGGGWRESSEELDRSREPRSEEALLTSVVSGDCSWEGGDREEELPEVVDSLTRPGELIKPPGLEAEEATASEGRRQSAEYHKWKPIRPSPRAPYSSLGDCFEYTK
jgi:hypothetical protein